MARNGWSSLNYSVAAYMPYYAPPISPQRQVVQNRDTPLMTPGLPGQQVDQHTTLVNREPRLMGIRWLYSRGGQIKPWFRMIATGAVERTKFQPVLAYQWSGEFNDAIYQAGWPRNLGYTFKVDTIPQQALATQREQMMPRPWIRKPYFARRAYTSGIKGVPVQATNPPRYQ